MNIRALLELCRISNLPTVWSNVALGGAWGFIITNDLARKDGALIYRDYIDLPTLTTNYLIMMVAGSLIYCGGMVLNDAMDASIDLAERPSRPIPSGHVSRKHAFLIACAMLLGGLGCLHRFIENPWVICSAIVLVLLVISYNLIHQKSAAGVILMGLCRAALIVMATTAVSAGEYGLTPVLAIPAIVLFAYTLAISLVARHEVPAGRAWVVSFMIVCMPLVDAIMLASISQWQIVAFCIVCAVLTWIGQRFVAGS